MAAAGRFTHPVMNERVGPQPMTSLALGGFDISWKMVAGRDALDCNAAGN